MTQSEKIKYWEDILKDGYFTSPDVRRKVESLLRMLHMKKAIDRKIKTLESDSDC